MKKAIIFLSFLVLTMVFSTAICFADNPIVQTSFTADPAPMVYQDRLYLYTSHDEDVTVGNFFTMNDWHLYSTVDMVNWTDHGTPASLRTFSWSTDNAWAPQAVPRDGKIFLYVPINNNTGAKIGVAVADNPIGPFKDAIGREIAQSGAMAIDPTVFIDNDGQAYLFWGNGNLRMVRLNSNMISTTGSVTSNIPMQGFTEGPWFYRRGSLYYMAYAGSGEKLSYATSNSPTGPWTFKGDIMGNPSIGTNHPGIVDYKGHSYLFYHNGALSGNNSFKRSVCVEEFTYGADGSIPRITGTSKGPNAIASLDPFEQVEAETIAYSSGLKTEVCKDTGGGMNVTSINNGDYIKVKDVDFQGGISSFDARVSSSGSNAKIELRLDSQNGTLLGTCDVSGASSWTTKTCTVSGASGKHDLFLKFTGGSGELFKFNWWKFTMDGTPGPTKEPTPEPTAVPTPLPGTVLIACGSSTEVEFFQPDQYYSEGNTYNNTNTIDVSGLTTHPAPAELFNNERYGEMSYRIPDFTSGASYEVTLYFAETYLTEAGGRIFDVLINGTEVLTGFDIYTSAGTQDKAIAESFTTTADESGEIVIEFVAGTENPKINGIGILPIAGPTAGPGIPGDVNESGKVDIVDALLIAQDYVGLDPSGYNAAYGDVNCSGKVDIVDALLVAQYYVGLTSNLDC
ncbi:MAG: family 43 glycosylhydrolase [Spirochaetales bacterium]|nr:family 43 glycosylhydrolase [Spirochaetales bacterium]